MVLRKSSEICSKTFLLFFELKTSFLFMEKLKNDDTTRATTTLQNKRGIPQTGQIA